MNTDKTMLPNALVKPVALFICLSIVSWVTHGLLTHGSIKVALAPQEQFGGQISQSMATNSTLDTPQIGLDYKLEKTRYFDNNNWVVTSLRDAKDNTAKGFVVLKKIDGVYVPVLGPGTVFPSSYRLSLPADTAKYLEEAGAFYDAS